MKLKRILTGPALLLCAAVLAALGPTAAHANSAQTHWSGIDASGALVAGEDCPLTVEHERLTVDVPEFPQNYYADEQDFLAYPAKVTAEYTFFNPSADFVTATLVFPFGRYPSYGYSDGSGVSDGDARRYEITVDGAPVEKTVRHTLARSDFDPSVDLALLHDGFAQDAFYFPGLPVTEYVYTVSGLAEDASAATMAFTLSADETKTRVLVEDQSGGSMLDGSVRLMRWAQNGETFSVWVIGEELPDEIVWTFYENGACQKQIDGAAALTQSKSSTFLEYAMRGYDADSGVSEADWYNARVASLNESAWAHGALDTFGYEDDLSLWLMRWYEYELTLGPGERVVNTVTAPIYPAIDGSYLPPVYEYTYLLSPARGWAAFGSLEIAVNTPYVMTASGLAGFAETETGYALSLDGLPEGELTFSLCSQASPAKPSAPVPFPAGVVAVCAAVGVLLLGGGIAAFVLIRRRRQTAGTPAAGSAPRPKRRKKAKGRKKSR